MLQQSYQAGTSEKYKLFLYLATAAKPKTGFFLYFSGLPISWHEKYKPSYTSKLFYP